MYLASHGGGKTDSYPIMSGSGCDGETVSSKQAAFSRSSEII